MLFTRKEKVKRNERLWHNWFAWYPVKLRIYGDKSKSVYSWAWLSVVSRRYSGFLTGQDGEKIYDYKEISQ